MPAKRRNPRMGAEEKAAMTKATKEVAEAMNAEIERLHEELKNARTPKHARDRERKNGQARARRKRQRRGTPDTQICAGTNLKGLPCKLPTLLKNDWDGPEEITGDYCLWHEPTLDRDSRESYKLFGSSKRRVPRKVTPGEIAHEAMKKAPHHFLRPYLKALGLEMTDDGEIVRKNLGLKLYGYSRGGEVIKSPYPDYAGQVQIAEKLQDRIFGKPRQAVDLASSNTTVAVNITMDPERVSKVADILMDVGALPNGNGNGHVIEGQAKELPVETSSDLD